MQWYLQRKHSGATDCCYSSSIWYPASPPLPPPAPAGALPAPPPPSPPRATRFISAAMLEGMGIPFIRNTVFLRKTCLCCAHGWSQLQTQGLDGMGQGAQGVTQAATVQCTITTLRRVAPVKLLACTPLTLAGVLRLGRVVVNVLVLASTSQNPSACGTQRNAHTTTHTSRKDHPT